jgi:hypothetical protein
MNKSGMLRIVGSSTKKSDWYADGEACMLIVHILRIWNVCSGCHLHWLACGKWYPNAQW